MSNGERKNGVPATVTSIPLVDPHALSADPSIGELVKDATAQVSTLVRAEVELARAEITRDVKKGMTGSIFFIAGLVVLFYSTFFFFFFLAELLDSWIWRWAAFLIVFGIMVLVTAVLALLGYLKVRRIRGPQKTIESVKETRSAFTGPRQAPVATTSPRHRQSLEDPRGGDPADPPGVDAAAGSVGHPHRRAVAPPRHARQRHPLPCRRGRPPTATATPATARPLVILLHGFGSFWWSWRHQLRGLPGPGWWRWTCAATAAATNHPAATTAGRWPVTPPD